MIGTTRTRQGFSLLELSVVLAIISVVVAFGVNMATTGLKGADRTTTQERLLVVQKALEAYARTNGYLPCPASRGTSIDAAGFGVEARNGTTRVDCVASAPGLVQTAGAPNIYIGAVPTRTLGLPDLYASDAWKNKLTYVVSGLHVGSMSSYITEGGAITVRTGDRTGTNFIITTQRETDGSNDAGPAATYLVFSHGPDGKGAYPLGGTSAAVACGSSTNNDVANCDDSDMVFYDSPYNDGSQASTFFDDYVIWGSNALDRLPTANGGPGTGCTGACELWCVACDAAWPPTQTPFAICKRTITSTSPCKALCEYAYPTSNVFCP